MERLLACNPPVHDIVAPVKYLTLIRHAKSSQENPALRDDQRPLNPRGLRDAPAMGHHLDVTFRFTPDLIVSSPAVRALHTARLIAGTIGYSEWQIVQDARIYEAPVTSLLDVIRSQDDRHQHVCLVGHNPGMEDLTNWLCGGQEVENVVTCAVIMLDLKITSWQKAGAGTASLKEYLYPSLIGMGKMLD